MAPKTRKIAVEIWGDLRIANNWVEHIRAIAGEMVVIEKEGWYEVLEGSNAAEALSEVGKLIKTLLEGGAPSQRVDWVRVETVED
jgi:hypothetical protein